MPTSLLWQLVCTPHVQIFLVSGKSLHGSSANTDPGHRAGTDQGPNSACDVALPLELTSGLGRDRGESGGLRGVLVAPARRRVKLGRLFIGIVGSGCTRSRIMRLGLVRVRTVDIKGTGGITG